jgi:hypothetical protein
MKQPARDNKSESEFNSFVTLSWQAGGGGGEEVEILKTSGAAGDRSRSSDPRGTLLPSSILMFG